MSGDAFKVMFYRCAGACRLRERIWNSRDGAVPFLVACRRCGADALRVRWLSERVDPKHVLAPGERYFRDGTDDEARAMVARRLDLAEGTKYAVPSSKRSRVIEDAICGFARGWPMLVEYAEEPACLTA